MAIPDYITNPQPYMNDPTGGLLSEDEAEELERQQAAARRAQPLDKVLTSAGIKPEQATLIQHGQTAGQQGYVDPSRLTTSQPPQPTVAPQASPQRQPTGSSIGRPSGPSSSQMMSAAEKQYGTAVTETYDAQRQAAIELQTAAQAQADAEQALLVERNERLERMQQEQQTKEQERQQSLNRRLADFEQFAKKPPSEQLDPERWWNNKSTGNKFLSAFAMFLGGAGRNGNAAMKVMDDKIAADVAAQKYNIDNARADWQQKLLTKTTAYGLAREQFQDERQAELAATNYTYQRVKDRLEVAASKTNNTETKTRIAEAIAGIDQKQASLNLELQKSEANRQLAKERSAAAAAAAQLKAREEQAWAERGYVKGPDGKFHRVNTDGSLGPVETPAGSGAGGMSANAQAKVGDIDAAEQSLDAIASAAGLKKNPRTGEYEGDASGIWRTGLGSSDRSQKVAALAKSAAALVGRAVEGNAPNESTMREFADGVLSPSGSRLRENLNAWRLQLANRRQGITNNPNQEDPAQARR